MFVFWKRGGVSEYNVRMMSVKVCTYNYPYVEDYLLYSRWFMMNKTVLTDK